MEDKLAIPSQAMQPAGAAFSSEQVALIKRTICAGATDDELQLFMAICGRTGLDPFSKQIYAIQRWDGRAGRNKMVIQTGIDGYRAIADRQANYAGSDEPLFDEGQTEYHCRAAGKAHPSTATVTVYKLVGGVRCPFTATASWESYCPEEKSAQMWRKMPYLMLAKCAEALALRKGWAAQLSGLYTDAEMAQASSGEYIEVQPDTQRQQREMKLDRQPEPEKPAGELLEYTVLKVEEKIARKSGAPYAVVTMKLGDNPPFNALYFNSKLNGHTGPIRAIVGSTKDNKPLMEHAEFISNEPSDWSQVSDDELGPPIDYSGQQTLMDAPPMSRGD